MTKRTSVTQSDAKYFKKEIKISKSIVKKPYSSTASGESINYFDSQSVPFVFFPKKALSVNSKKIISGILRKHAIAWANLANK